MGLYDTILVPCPVCGELYGAQSKSGNCILNEYMLDEAPSDVLEDINRHAPFICDCGAVFAVRLKITPEILNLTEEGYGEGNDDLVY